VVFADSEVIADKAFDAVLPMPMREDVKTTTGEACSLPTGQEPMETSS